jgi:hypothetical protein
MPRLLLPLLLLLLSASAFHPLSSLRRNDFTSLLMSVKQPVKGAGFNYDPAKYQDSNSGNYRRLSDQLAARKAEDEKLARERDELIRKEKMAEMLIKQENSTFWDTPDDKIVATSDKFFIDPNILRIIEDLDNQLIGLRPVKDKLRRYASQMLTHKIRQ